LIAQLLYFLLCKKYAEGAAEFPAKEKTLWRAGHGFNSKAPSALLFRSFYAKKYPPVRFVKT
jgi:hypothetical protein